MKPAGASAAWKRSGALAVSELIIRARSLMILPLLARIVGTEGIGIYAQIAAISAFVAPVIAAGTDSAAMRWLAGRERAEVNAGVFSLLTAQVLIGAILAAVAAMAHTFLGEFLLRDSRLGWFVVSAVPLALGSAGVTTCKSLFRLTADARNYSRLSIVHCILSLAAAFGFTLANGGLPGTVAGLFSADLVIILITIVMLARTADRVAVEWNVLRRLFTTGAWFMPAAYCMWVVNMADRSFLARWSGLQAVGIYATAYGVGFAVVQAVFNPFWVLYPPMAARHINAGDHATLLDEFRRSMNSAFFLALPCLGLVSALADPILATLASRSFVGGAPLIPIIGCAYVLSMVNGYYDTCLLLQGQQRWITIALVSAAATNVGLNAALIPVMGPLGAAIATLVAFGVQLTISVVQASQRIRLIPDTGFLARATIATVGMILVSRALPSSGKALPLLVNIAGSLAVYALLLLVSYRGRFGMLALSLNGKLATWKLAS